MNKKGFSLIEVLIAVGILAGMGLLISVTMSRTLTGKAHVEDRDEVLHSVRLGFSKMTEDLSQAFLANTTLKGKDTTYQTGLKGDETNLDFSTLSHLHFQKNAKDTDQVTVGYHLENNDRGFHDLVRRESSTLSEKIDEGGASYLLIENIKEFKLQYYDNNKEVWQTTWDTTQISNLGHLPQAVKIDLTVVELADENSHDVVREFQYQTITPVDLYQNEINF